VPLRCPDSGALAGAQYLAHNVERWTTPADQYMKLRASQRAARVRVPAAGSAFRLRDRQAARRPAGPPQPAARGAQEGAVLSRSTSPRSHASALATPFAGGSPAAPGPAAALPTSRDAGGAPAHRAGGEVDARAGGAAPAQDGGRAEAGRGAATAAGGGGGRPPPPPPPAGPAGPAADGGGGGGGGSGAAGGPAAARRSSNALSDLGAEVQSPSSASRCAPWSAPRAALRGGGAGGRRPMQGAGAAGRARRPAAESLEAQLSHKLAEYAENRSLTSVVPVCDPLTTDEPELLEMSPEQAEETQLCAPRL